MKRSLFLVPLLMAGLVLADSNYPADSLYQMHAKLTDQSAQEIGLNVYEGHPVLVTLFYGSCSHTCPLLIEAVRAVDKAAAAPELRVLMISIDPERDTVEILNKLAKERRIDSNRWTLARGDAQTVRHIAAALNIQYRQTPDGEFNHTSVVTLLSSSGQLVHQSSILGKADAALLQMLRNSQDED